MNERIRDLFKEELIVCLDLTVEEADKVIEAMPTEIQALRLSASLRSKRICDLHVSKKAAGLRALLELFTLESLIFYEKGSKVDKFKRLLQEHVSLDGQILLLTHFTFSEPYKFKTDRGKCRHLMYADFLKDQHFRSMYMVTEKEPEYCSMSLCYCQDWLKCVFR